MYYTLGMGTTLTIRISEELNDWLEEEAKLTGVPKSQIVRNKLNSARNLKSTHPFADLAGIVKDKAPDLSTRKGLGRERNR
jgi:hypothetical protein